MAKLDPRSMDTLYDAFANADILLTKKYVSEMDKLNVYKSIEAIRNIGIGRNISLFKISQIVYDAHESIHDKLTTVYSSLCSDELSALVLLLRGTKTNVELYIGVASRKFNDEKTSVLSQILENEGGALRGVIEGHFPGTKLEPVSEVDELINGCFEKITTIASVSSIAALRNQKQEKNDEFIQGMEKFIDSMRGKTYTVVYLADVMPTSKIEFLCSEYEDIYAQLSPFKQSVQTLNENTSLTDTNSTSESIADTISDSLGKTLAHGTTHGITKSNTIGGGVHGGCPFVGASINYSRSWGTNEGTTETEGKTDTHTVAKSLTTQNSVAQALTNGTGESLQVTYDNRAVRTLLERIDEQIKRLRSCEDFGLFDACVYFLSDNYVDAVTAASTYKSLIRGENSSVESSAVNVWSKNNIDQTESVELISEYLKKFYHPLFSLHDAIQVSPALLISGNEVAYQFSLPKKSVPGLPILTCAEFGRNIVKTSGDYYGNLEIGNIYHMHTENKEQKVCLSQDALTSHVFITGSTGAGKSNTVFKLLTQANTNYLVIEPAKGEYKSVLGGNKGVKVFGTNPKVTDLLKINPFSFPNNIAVSEHIDRLVEIFNVCWPMYAAMPAILKDSVIRAYQEAGWDITTSENCYCNNLFPTFRDILIQIKEVLNESDYSSDNKGDYTGALVTRLKSLTNGINGQIFCPNGLTDEELFDEKVIVDLSRVGSTETKALIMGLLVMKLQEYRLSASLPDNSKLKHITVLEEAHNLLKRTSTEQSSDGANLLGKSVEMLTNAIAEMRAFGEGFIIADQAPGLLDMAAIRNTNTKIIHRLPDQSDRELVGKAAGLNDEQIKELAKLETGVAAVYQNDWVDAVLCKVTEFTDKKSYTIPNGSTQPPQRKIDNDARKAIVDIMVKPHGEVTLDENLIFKSSFSAFTKVYTLKMLKAGSQSVSSLKQAKIIDELFVKIDLGRKANDFEQTREEVRNSISKFFEHFDYSQKEIDKLIVLFTLAQTDLNSVESMKEAQLRLTALEKENGGA